MSVQASQGHQGQAHAMTILVVEDDSSFSQLLKEVFEQENYNVLSASTASEAWDALETSNPDLIVLDRQLPDQDGIALCRQIKSRERWKRTPLLFLSARNSVDDIVLGLEAGGDDYLGKPFHCAELAARVGALTRQNGKRMAVMNH